MAGNRKSRMAAVPWGSLLGALGLCAFFCGAGMGYVWHRNRNEQLSRRIQSLAIRLEQLQAVNQVLDRHLEELHSPRAVDAAARRWNLGLEMPQPEQILRIREGKHGTALAAPRVQRLVARSAAAREGVTR